VFIANSGMSGNIPRDLPSKPTVDEIHKELWSWDSHTFTSVFKLNTRGVFFSVIAILPLLDAGNKKGNVSQKSQVIATSSVAAFNRQYLEGFACDPSKIGTTHMMKQLATMLTPLEIRSNVIAPGRE
jgi:NAD(P)-dependent dehydrogenase (short-subunit alcohol dehydrogenase family)